LIQASLTVQATKKLYDIKLYILLTEEKKHTFTFISQSTRNQLKFQ